MATGAWLGAAPKAQVFDAASGRLVVELPVAEATGVGFSPDSQYLLTSQRDGYHFFGTATWESRGHVKCLVDGGASMAAFSPAGDPLAVLDSPSLGLVRLVDPREKASCASLATVEAPTWNLNDSAGMHEMHRRAFLCRARPEMHRWVYFSAGATGGTAVRRRHDTSASAPN